MFIGDLASHTGISTKTIRYYESIGLLPEPPRTPGGYRDYDEGAITRLRFVKAAQAAGLRLREIGRVLSVRDGGEAPCHHVEALLRRRLDEVDERLEQLQRARGELLDLVARAEQLDPADCADDEICHILTRG